jgi:hypothetical protein
MRIKIEYKKLNEIKCSVMELKQRTIQEKDKKKSVKKNDQIEKKKNAIKCIGTKSKKKTLEIIKNKANIYQKNKDQN